MSGRLLAAMTGALAQLPSAVGVLPASVLVESKTAGRAGAADLVLRELLVRPIQVSKYCVAAALLNPQLRANPWHRTLRQLTPRE